MSESWSHHDSIDIGPDFREKFILALTSGATSQAMSDFASDEKFVISISVADYNSIGVLGNQGL